MFNGSKLKIWVFMAVAFAAPCLVFAETLPDYAGVPVVDTVEDIVFDIGDDPDIPIIPDDSVITDPDVIDLIDLKPDITDNTDDDPDPYLPGSMELIEVPDDSADDSQGDVKRSFVLPKGLIQIEDEAFMGTLAMTEVIVPDGVEVIGSRAFANTGLLSIRLPESIVDIAADAFDGLQSGFFAVVETGSQAEVVCAAKGIPFRAMGAYPESSHPYRYEAVNTWQYTCPFETEYIRITFSEDTEIFDDQDEIRITDRDGKTVTYTGRSLSGAEVFLRGNSFTIQLVEYDNIQAPDDLYGFKITKVVGLTEAEYHAPWFRISDGMITYYASAEERSILKIPESVDGQRVIGIGSGVFSGHSELQRVELPDGLETIDTSAFKSCNGLREIVLPESLKVIGSSAFHYCSALQEMILPDSVTDIGSYAFAECRGLKKLRLPQGLESVADNLCYRCDSLTEMTLPERLTGIGGTSFGYCTSLKRVTLPEGLKRIGTNAFRNCGSLGAISFPQSLEQIGANAFQGCSGLAEVSIPERTTTIGASAFDRCTGLMRVNLSRGVSMIGDGAFAGCTVLREIQVDEGNSVYASVDGILFNREKTEILICPAGITGAFTIPATMTRIGGYVFDGCSGLTGITLHDGITSIGECAFQGCTGLTEIWIPDSVISFGKGGFRNCTGLETVHLPGEIQTIAEELFYGCSALSGIDISEGVTGIGESAFESCTSLTGLRIPGSVTWIGAEAFRSSGLISIWIPNSVTRIDRAAFEYCGALTGVSLPGSLTGIADYLFSECNGLERITVPNGVTAIGQFAFYDCDKLEDVRLPRSLRVIEFGAFNRCRSLWSMTIPAGVTDLGESAFGECDSLSRLLIPGSVTQISDRLFYQPWTEWTGYETCSPTVYGEPGSEAASFGHSWDRTFAELIPVDGLIRSVSGGIGGAALSIFFDPFDTSHSYGLYASESLDGEYYPVASYARTYKDCLVFDYSGRNGRSMYFRILSNDQWTVPFRVEGYETRFLTEDQGEGIKIVGVLSMDTMTELNVPDSIDGKTVTGIAEDAFAEFTRLKKLFLPSRMEDWGAELIRPSEEMKILLLDDGNVRSALEVIRSVAWTESGQVFTVFFDAFEGDRTYTLYASETIDGEYKPVTVGGGTLFGCRTIVYGAADSAAWYYRIRGKVFRTTPFRASDFGTAFRTEPVEGGLRIIGVYSGNTMTEIEVPASIGGTPVTDIAENAFSAFTNLELIVLPDGLMTFRDTLTMPGSSTSVISKADRQLFDRIEREGEVWLPCSGDAGMHYLASYTLKMESSVYPALNRSRTVTVEEAYARKESHDVDLTGMTWQEGPDPYTFLHYGTSVYAKCSVCGMERNGTTNDFYAAEVRGLHRFGEDGRCEDCGHARNDVDTYYWFVAQKIMNGENAAGDLGGTIKNRLVASGFTATEAADIYLRLLKSTDNTMRNNYLLSLFLYHTQRVNDSDDSEYRKPNRTLYLHNSEGFDLSEVFFHEVGHAIQFNTVEKSSLNDTNADKNNFDQRISPHYALENAIQISLIEEGEAFIAEAIRSVNVHDGEFANAVYQIINKCMMIGSDSALGMILGDMLDIYSDAGFDFEDWYIQIAAALMQRSDNPFIDYSDINITDAECDTLKTLFTIQTADQRFDKNGNCLDQWWVPEEIQYNLYLRAVYCLARKRMEQYVNTYKSHSSNADIFSEVIDTLTYGKVQVSGAHPLGYHYQNGKLKYTLMREAWAEYVSGQIMQNGKEIENRNEFHHTCQLMDSLAKKIEQYYLKYFGIQK